MNKPRSVVRNEPRKLLKLHSSLQRPWPRHNTDLWKILKLATTVNWHNCSRPIRVKALSVRRTWNTYVPDTQCDYHLYLQLVSRSVFLASTHCQLELALRARSSELARVRSDRVRVQVLCLCAPFVHDFMFACCCLVLSGTPVAAIGELCGPKHS